MKNDRLIPGVILVMIGLAFLLHSLWHIDVNWSNLIGLWPIFLIIAGVNLLFANNRSAIATTLKVGLIVAGFSLVLFTDFGNRFGFPYYVFSWHSHHHSDNDDNNSDNSDDDSDTAAMGKNLVKVSGVSNFNLPYTADAKTAKLNISGGATKYYLSEPTDELFKADTKSYFGDYVLSHSSDNSNYILNFDMNGDRKGHFFWHSNHDDSNTVIFKLNTNPIWDINVNTGVSAVNFDLSKFKISTIDFNGGFASAKLKLGQPIETTTVTISSGAAKFDISIPKNAACKIISDTGLATDNFDKIGLTKTDDGDYETSGYDDAKNKMIININGGMADFKVHRY